MVVEVIARQIGKRRGGESDAVEAKLRQAVARRLDRDMIDAAQREVGEILMEADRVGCRQRPRAPPGR